MQKKDNNNKSLARNSLAIFAAKFFPAIAFSIVWIIASKNIGVTFYGVFQKMWTQLFVFAAIGSMGIPIFILTYGPSKVVAIIHYLNKKFLLIFCIFISLIALLFGYLQAQHSTSIFNIPSVFLVLVYIGLSLSDSLMIVFKNFRAIIIINILFSLGFVFIHYINIIPQFHLQSLIAQLLGLGLVRLLCSMYFVRKSYIQELQHSVTLSSEDAVKIKNLWIQMGLNELITQMFRWVDKFILSFILSQELFAIYFNGSTEFQFLTILFSAVSSAAVQYWANHQNDIAASNKVNLLLHSARILSAIMLPLFGFFLFFRIEFLSTVFSNQYTQAANIFICAQLVLPLRSYPFTALLQSEHRGDIINKGAIVDFVIACLLMYPLYLTMGLPGVALSFVISTYWQAAYYLFKCSQITQIPIAQLFPIKMLGKRLVFFGILMWGGHAVAQYITESTTTRFFIGFALLMNIIFFTLWQDWKRKD